MNWPRQVKPHRDKPAEPKRPFWLFRLSSRPGYILSLLLLSRKLESSFTRIEENEKRKLAELSISFSVIERKTCATKKNILLIQYFQFQSFECLSFLFKGSCLFALCSFPTLIFKNFSRHFFFIFLSRENQRFITSFTNLLKISSRSGKTALFKTSILGGGRGIFSCFLSFFESNRIHYKVTPSLHHPKNNFMSKWHLIQPLRR